MEDLDRESVLLDERAGNSLRRGVSVDFGLSLPDTLFEALSRSSLSLSIDLSSLSLREGFSLDLGSSLIFRSLSAARSLSSR